MREILPSRRLQIIEDLTYDSQAISIGVGFDTSGHVKEVFMNGCKVGSDQEALMQDVCILLSRALQSGAVIQDLAGGLVRQTTAAGGQSFLAAILERLAEVEAEAAAAIELVYRRAGQ